MRLSRRRWIEVGLAGGALLAVGGAAFRWLSSGYALRSGEAALAFSEKELCVARALVDALFPAADGFPSGVALGIHQEMDQQAWAADEVGRSELRAALELLEHVPPLFGLFGRFTSLERASRLEVFERLATSKRDTFVQIAMGLRQMAQLLYYGNEAVWNAIGYDGPWVRQARPPESALRYASLLQERSKGPA